MIKIRLLFLLFFSLFAPFGVRADVWSNCMDEVVEKSNFIQNINDLIAKNMTSGEESQAVKIEGILYNQTNALQILDYLTVAIGENCRPWLVELAGEESKSIEFRLPKENINVDKDVLLKVDIDMEILFDGMPVQTALMVSDKRLPLGVDFNRSDIKKEPFWDSRCSDHWVAFTGINGNSSVSKAGQRTFSGTAVSNNADDEYYLDFNDGDRRFFPGVVLLDKHMELEDMVVVPKNLALALRWTQKFTNELKGTPCAGNSVYLVDISGAGKTYGSSAGAAAVAGGVGVAAYGVGIIGGAATLGVSGAAGMATLGAYGGVGLATTAGTIATTAIWVPIVGWGIAGGALITAGILLFKPADLGKRDVVVPLAGPFVIRN